MMLIAIILQKTLRKDYRMAIYGGHLSSSRPHSSRIEAHGCTHAGDPMWSHVIFGGTMAVLCMAEA